MSGFDENDVTIYHARLIGGRGYLRLTHRPSALFVDADLNSEPVLKTRDALMHDLRDKVLEWMEVRRGSRDDLPGPRDQT